MEIEERAKGRELFRPAKVQAEVNKSAQAYFYSYFRQLHAGHEKYLDFDVSEAMPDFLIHQPGPNHNRAVAEVKRAGGADKTTPRLSSRRRLARLREVYALFS